MDLHNQWNFHQRNSVEMKLCGAENCVPASAQAFRHEFCAAFSGLLSVCLVSCDKFLFLTSSFLPSAAAQTCGSQGVAVQVLGSGGPELQDKRASTSYLVWEDGQAKALIDAGGGSALRFGESGAQMSQLDVIFFCHFHVDHSGDFSALIKSSWFEDRKNPLPIYGPPGNDFMPSTTEFVSISSETSTEFIAILANFWSRRRGKLQNAAAQRGCRLQTDSCIS